MRWFQLRCSTSTHTHTLSNRKWSPVASFHIFMQHLFKQQQQATFRASNTGACTCVCAHAGVSVCVCLCSQDDVMEAAPASFSFWSVTWPVTSPKKHRETQRTSEEASYDMVSLCGRCMCVCARETCPAQQPLSGPDEGQDVGIGLLVSSQRGGGSAGWEGSGSKKMVME